MTKKQLFLIDYADCLSDALGDGEEINSEHWIYKTVKTSVDQDNETSVAIGSHVQSNVFELLPKWTEEYGQDELFWMNPEHYKMLAKKTGAKFSPLLMNDILQAKDPQQFVLGSTLQDDAQRERVKEYREKRVRKLDEAKEAVKKAQEKYQEELPEEARKELEKVNADLEKLKIESTVYRYNLICPLFYSKILLIYAHAHALASLSSSEDEITITFVDCLRTVLDVVKFFNTYPDDDLLPKNVAVHFYYVERHAKPNVINVINTTYLKLDSIIVGRKNGHNPLYPTNVCAAARYHRQRQEELRGIKNGEGHFEWIDPIDYHSEFGVGPLDYYSSLLSRVEIRNRPLPSLLSRELNSQSSSPVPAPTNSITSPSVKTTIGGVAGAGLVSFGISALLHSAGISSFGMGAGAIGGGIFSAATLGWGTLVIGIVWLGYMIYRSYQNHKAQKNYQFISTDASVNNTSSRNQSSLDRIT